MSGLSRSSRLPGRMGNPAATIQTRPMRPPTAPALGLTEGRGGGIRMVRTKVVTPLTKTRKLNQRLSNRRRSSGIQVTRSRSNSMQRAALASRPPSGGTRKRFDRAAKKKKKRRKKKQPKRMKEKDLQTLSIFVPEAPVLKAASYLPPHKKRGDEYDYMYHNNISYDEFLRSRRATSFRKTTLAAVTQGERTNLTPEQAEMLRELDSMRFRDKNPPTHAFIGKQGHSTGGAEPLRAVFDHPSMRTDVLQEVWMQRNVSSLGRLSNVYQNKSNVKEKSSSKYSDYYNNTLADQAANSYPTIERLEQEYDDILVSYKEANLKVKGRTVGGLKTESVLQSSFVEYADLTCLNDPGIHPGEKNKIVNSNNIVKFVCDLKRNIQKDSSGPRGAKKTSRKRSTKTSDTNNFFQSDSKDLMKLLTSYYSTELEEAKAESWVHDAEQHTVKAVTEVSHQHNDQMECGVCGDNFAPLEPAHVLGLVRHLTHDKNVLFSRPVLATTQTVNHLFHMLKLDSVDEVRVYLDKFVQLGRQFADMDDLVTALREVEATGKFYSEAAHDDLFDRFFNAPQIQNIMEPNVWEFKDEFEAHVEELLIICRGYAPELSHHIQALISTHDLSDVSIDKYKDLKSFIGELRQITTPRPLSHEEQQAVLSTLAASNIFQTSTVKIGEEEMYELIYMCERGEFFRAQKNGAVMETKKQHSVTVLLQVYLDLIQEVGRKFNNMNEVIRTLCIFPRTESLISSTFMLQVAQFFQLPPMVQMFEFEEEGVDCSDDPRLLLNGADATVLVRILGSQLTAAAIVKKLHRWLQDYQKELGKIIKTRQEKRLLSTKNASHVVELTSLRDFPKYFVDTSHAVSIIKNCIDQQNESQQIARRRKEKQDMEKRDRYANSWEKRKEEGRRKYQAKMAEEKAKRDAVVRAEFETKEQRRIQYEQAVEARQAHKIEQERQIEQAKLDKIEQQRKRQELQAVQNRELAAARVKFVERMLKQQAETEARNKTTTTK